MRIKLIIEYDGTNFCGWQKQLYKCSKPSIQETIEYALYSVFGKKEYVELFCSGRTDAGVHAFNQVAHFDICNESLIKRWSTKISSLPNAINFNILTRDIVIKFAEVVDNSFHSRFSAKMRYYKYYILNTSHSTVFWFMRAWHIRQNLDIDSMKKAAYNLLGRHDFNSFRSTQCGAKNSVRTIDAIYINKTADSIIEISVNAQSFLHNQVRIIVGTLVDVGLGKLTPDYILYILEERDRRRAGQTAPPYGLFFDMVRYS